MASSRLHVDILWYSDILWSDVLLAKHDYTHHWWAERCQRNSPDDPVELRTTLNGRWDILNDLGACGTSSCGKRTQMPPQRTVRSTTRTQDNQWNTLKQCELFCKKGACIVLPERRAVCCFMFGTGLVCKSMLMRVSRKERFLASAEMNAAGQKCLPDLREPKAKRGTWGQLPFPSLICSEVLTGFRIFRPVIDQMHTHTYIFILLVYRSDCIRFIYNYRQTETHNGISQSKISKILCANFRLNALCQDVALKFQDVFCGYVIAIRISLLSFILS